MDYEYTPPTPTNACAMRGDITRVASDMIVNAANKALIFGGGVDGAIHLAAGPAVLQAELDKFGGCPTGQVVVTSGFAMPCKYIAHTPGPVYAGHGLNGEPLQLMSCYRRCFEVAVDLGCETIAFPCISTGVYRYPKEEAARIAIRQANDYGARMKAIRFVCFDEENYQIYERLLS